MPSEKRATKNYDKEEDESHSRSKSKKHSKDRDDIDLKEKKHSSERRRPDNNEDTSERKHRSSKDKDKDDQREHRSSKKHVQEREHKDDRKPRSSKDEDRTDERKHRSSKKNEDNREETSERKHRSSKKNDGEYHEVENKVKSKSHKSSKDENETKRDNDRRRNSKNSMESIEEEGSKNKKISNKFKLNLDEDEDRKSGQRSSRMDEKDKNDKHERDERSLHRYESARYKKSDPPVQEEDPNYDDDFDDDFEDDDSENEKPVQKKESRIIYSSDEEVVKRKNSINSDRSRDDYDEYMRGRVMKPNAHVQVPTELVEVYSSKILFNHDSLDRAKRRAKDLLKTIELDKKSFNLLDINPEDMRTVYSAHLKHEKVQTNDDTIEIEIQTDEIDYITRWTQYPPEDLKGYGTENNNLTDAYEEDLFGKFRLEVNFLELHNFLNKSSKVVEAILKENNADSIGFTTENKSEFEFSKGFTNYHLPKFVNKLTKHAILSECTFCQDDPNFIVCTYDLETTPNRFTSSLLVVWNVEDAIKPYKVLICESKSNCLAYTSFMVFSGNMDGSIAVWDLREPFNLHLANFKKKQFSTEESVVRSPTYSTAGVLLNENHFSEVKAIISLQNKDNRTDNEQKSVFLQLASLELESKLIIWTVVELNHIDLAGFETDLGLLPGGRIKLVKSSQINLNQLLISPFGKDKYQTLGMVCPVNQTNNLYINTNLGRIIHILRESNSSSLTTLKSEFDDGNSQVTVLKFHHELTDILLAGYGNGEIRLYHVKYTTPIKTWHFGCNGNSIKEIHWITSKSSSFLIIDELKNLYIWNLLEDDTSPLYSKQIEGLCQICVSEVPQIQKNSDQPQSVENNDLNFGMFNVDSKELEIHLFHDQWTKKAEKESKKFAKFIRNVLLTF